MTFATKSPWVIHYDASSCNGCDIEVLATLCPGFDGERFGVVNTGNPKHADIFLVTGSVNEQNIGVVREIYDQMLEPKVVVACGICACTGGGFQRHRRRGQGHPRRCVRPGLRRAPGADHRRRGGRRGEARREVGGPGRCQEGSVRNDDL